MRSSGGRPPCGSAGDYACAVQQAFPVEEAENAYRHLRIADYSDAVAALPPEELQVQPFTKHFALHTLISSHHAWDDAIGIISRAQVTAMSSQDTLLLALASSPAMPCRTQPWHLFIHVTCVFPSRRRLSWETMRSRGNRGVQRGACALWRRA